MFRSRPRFNATHSGVVFAILLQWACSPSSADIIGGEEVSSHDPIQRSIVGLYSQTPQGGALCTATLITKNIALTAAHCLEGGIEKSSVLFGTDLSQEENVSFPVVSAVVNADWDRNASRDSGDIALIRFSGKLPAGYSIAKLASKRSSLRAGDQLILAGFGIADATTHSGAGILRRAEVQVSNPDFSDSEILIDQTDGSGACHGDSGGPALIIKNGGAVLVGITNRAFPDSAPDDCQHEAVYAKVSFYRDFIREAVKKLKSKISDDEVDSQPIDE